MKSKKQVKPKWFNGVIYPEGTTVRNPFSGEEYELNALELSIYDFIIGANMTLEKAYDRQEEPNNRLKKIYKDLHKGLDWFKEYNAEAYMVLLD
jgi:hypothetical protein|tara:strand:+ start:255 stop:536 length:282 start_codon:yes stop_codon:yes gene_type:complete